MRNNGLVVFVNRDVNHILDDLDLEIRPLVKESIEYMKNDTLYTKKWHISKLVMKVALPMRYKKLLKLCLIRRNNGRHTRICIPNYI